MTYIIHIRAERINAQNVWTACKRVVSPSMVRVDANLSDCVECLHNTHANLSFEQTRDKLLRLGGVTGMYSTRNAEVEA